MLSEYSVRKPYTVVVAVILTIVLGFISFSEMTTDLLPSVELPYVVVLTPAPGSSPEKVEQAVTRPLEGALGTVRGLSSIQSISRESSSIIFLEYVQGTNMDSAMIELSGSVDLVKAQLEEGVGTPMLLRLSPDMLPIVVASVDVEGMDIETLSRFVQDTVLPSFERQEGVAAVNVNGLVEQRLEVVLKREAILALNEKVQASLAETFEENRMALEEAQTELAKGKETLSREGGTQKTELAKAGVQLNEAMGGLTALLAEESQLEVQKAAFLQERAFLEEMLTLDNLMEGLFPVDLRQMTEEMFRALQEEGTLALPEALSDFSLADLQELSLQAAGAALRMVSLDMELQNIRTRQMVLQAMKPQLESGLAQARSAYQQVEAGKITMAVELAKAQMTIENGEAELEKGLAEFEKARIQAMEGADLTAILTEDLVKNLLLAQNFGMPAGYLRDETGQILVKVGDPFESPEDMEAMVLFHMEPVGDIRLDDIATLTVTDNIEDMYTKVNGNVGILMTFQKQSTASTAAVSQAIEAESQRLEAQYPGLAIRPMMDQGDYIDIITGNVLQNLIFGGILAILVLLLFLRDIKPTFVIALSIPISVMFAVVLMYFSNVTLNVISLSGLALGVGMLVDNSIVVVENIYRLRSAGMSAAKAAVEGSRQVSGAIFASTLTTICVFLPIVFTQGISRELFTDMGLTIAYSLLASLLVALTLVPSMGATLLKKNVAKDHRWFDGFVRVYGKALRFALGQRLAVLLLALALLGVSIYGTTIMGTAFIPEIDSPQMSATLTPPEDMTQGEVFALSDAVAERILAIDAVETVGAMQGGGGGPLGFGGGGGGGDATTFYIMLKEDRSLTNRDVERLILQGTEDLAGEIQVSASEMDLSALGGSGVQVQILGQDLDALAALAAEVGQVMETVPGLHNVETGLEDSGEEIRIQVDKAKAMREGITVVQVFAGISGALQGETAAGSLGDTGDSIPVVLVNRGEEGLTRDTMEDFPLTVTDRMGEEKTVRLGDIATITEAKSLSAIRRVNQARYLTVSAEVEEGYNIGLVSRDFEAALEAVSVPEGIQLQLEGENETIQTTMRDLVRMILLAIVFIYLIMVAQFQDLLSPFIVLFTLPLAFTGGLLLLWGTGMELSIIAMLGFLVLSGVVVNNGIVFVSYVNQLREAGMEKREALVEAGLTRIRPIIMTALTTVLAMTTLALGVGSGAEMMQPMAVTTIGGLSYATLLTLFVVPILYDLLHRSKIRRGEVD